MKGYRGGDRGTRGKGHDCRGGSGREILGKWSMERG